MNSVAAENYHARFRKVLEYLDAHLDDELVVDQICGVATFSKFHFHRQFSALFGINVGKYIQLTRLKRASCLLAFRDQPIIDIALASGYEGPEAFARAFKKLIGQTPTEFRQQPQWQPWYAAYQSLSNLRVNHMQPANQCEQVSIINFAATKVAAFEHRGDPERIGNSIRTFIEWRKHNKLPQRVSATFNVFYDDPATTAAADYRLDICAATDREVTSNTAGVISKIIPGGRCAVLRHTGSDDTLVVSIKYMYLDWLPHSGEELRDFPLYAQRVCFFPDVPEHEAVTDLFLPLR